MTHFSPSSDRLLPVGFDGGGLTDLQAAVAVLQDQGVSREEAFQIVVGDPGVTSRLAEPIRAFRERVDAQAREAARRAYERTPEGRTELARKAAAAKEARSKLAADARVLLEPSLGDTSDLSDAGVLRAAGIEPPTDDRPPGLWDTGDGDSA